MPRNAVFHDSGSYDDGSPLTFGGVNTFAKSGDTQLTGDVTISAGTNVTLTQAGQDIAIASTGGGGGSELDYVSRNTDLTVTATSAATAQAWIAGNAVSYNGSTRVKIEAWCAAGATGGGAGCNLLLELYDGSTDLGVLAQLSDPAAIAFVSPMYGVYFVTPSNASHTFHVKAWETTSNGTLFAAPVYLPAWYRITTA